MSKHWIWVFPCLAFHFGMVHVKFLALLRNIKPSAALSQLECFPRFDSHNKQVPVSLSAMERQSPSSGPLAPSLWELSFWDKLCLTRETGHAGLEVVG